MYIESGVALAADTTTRIGSGLFVVIFGVIALAILGKKSDTPRSGARKGGAGFFIVLAVIAAMYGGGGQGSKSPTPTTPPKAPVSTTHNPPAHKVTPPTQHNSCKPGALLCFHN